MGYKSGNVALALLILFAGQVKAGETQRETEKKLIGRISAAAPTAAQVLRRAKCDLEWLAQVLKDSGVVDPADRDTLPIGTPLYLSVEATPSCSLPADAKQLLATTQLPPARKRVPVQVEKVETQPQPTKAQQALSQQKFWDMLDERDNQYRKLLGRHDVLSERLRRSSLGIPDETPKPTIVVDASGFPQHQVLTWGLGGAVGFLLLGVLIGRISRPRRKVKIPEPRVQHRTTIAPPGR